MRFRGSGFVVVAALAAMAACDSTMTTAGSGRSATVNVGDNFFSAESTHIAPGDTVFWIWGGGAAHDVRSFLDLSLWCGTRTTGICYRVFPTAGRFTYFCSYHPGMEGIIGVQ